MRTALYHRSAHVPDSKLSPPLRTCRFCGSSFAKPPIARIQQTPEVLLLRCTNCHACSASRMPTSDALNEYYANYFEPSAPKITHDSPAHFAGHVASFIRLRKRELTITDFGGGDGTLAYHVAQILCERGCSSAKITVVDYVEPLVSDDVRITVRAARPSSSIPQSDVILASAVLEHIADPLIVLTRLFAALKRSGVLYARTPAVAGFMKLAAALGTHLDFTFPAHLYDFGQKFWENMLSFVPNGTDFELAHSAPSLVETGFRQHPWHTLAAHLAKAPWRLFGRKYALVGGWEVVFTRK